MPTQADAGDTPLAPDDAFAVLGNETRMGILQTLAEAEGPLPFSALRKRVGVGDSGQFNYHLDKLSGHFVGRTNDGYELQRAGERVIEAVLSGAVTESPVLERQEIDQSCHYCGAPRTEVAYREEQVGLYCSECSGTYGGSAGAEASGLPADQERLGYLELPPAGVRGRTPKELFQAAFTWFLGEVVTATRGVCPRCSAPVDVSLSVCESHDSTEGLCEQCDRRYAAVSHFSCTNCIFDIGGVLGAYLVVKPELRAFLYDHGLDLDTPSSERLRKALTIYDEAVLTTTPFEGRFTFTIDDESLTLTVDEHLNVVDASRSPTAETA